MAYNPQRSRELLLHRRRTSELAVFLMFGRSFGNDSKHGDKTGQVCTSQKCILQRARREFFKEKWAKLLDHFLIETDKWAAGAHWECVGLLRREASTMFEQVESNFSEPRMSNLIEFKGECIRCVFIGVRGEQCSPVGIVLNQHTLLMPTMFQTGQIQSARTSPSSELVDERRKDQRWVLNAC